MISRIETTGLGRVGFAHAPDFDCPLGDNEVEGSTIVSVVSPGTELQLIASNDEKPRGIGYAAIFQIERCGAAVEGLKLGDIVYCPGSHANRQRSLAAEVTRIPEHLSPEAAVLARFLCISWTTLITTAARPPTSVLVTGLGVVGNLAAQLFQAAGYTVTTVDPVESRRRIASNCGLVDVREAVAVIPFNRFADPLSGEYALTVECSGHEAAVLEAARATRHGGEIVLVGCPWQRRTNIPVHDLLDIVFHHYVTVRSGWEWELPRHRRAFDRASIAEANIGAMKWLQQGRIRTEGIARVGDPRDAERIYRDFHVGEELTVLFDWRAI